MPCWGEWPDVGQDCYPDNWPLYSLGSFFPKKSGMYSSTSGVVVTSNLGWGCSLKRASSPWHHSFKSFILQFRPLARQWQLGWSWECLIPFLAEVAIRIILLRGQTYTGRDKNHEHGKVEHPTTQRVSIYRMMHTTSSVCEHWLIINVPLGGGSPDKAINPPATCLWLLPGPQAHLVRLSARPCHY